MLRATGVENDEFSKAERSDFREIRQRLNEFAGLEGEAFTPEIRTESDKLQGEFRDKETQYRSAVIAEAETERRDATDGAGAELRGLLAGAGLGAFFQAAVEHRSLDGREGELQAHFKLAGNQFPIELLRDPKPVEHRAVTAAPSDVGASQRPILQPVFAGGDAEFLGTDMPIVDSGDAVFPVLTTRPSVRGPFTSNDSAAETDGSFSAKSLSPSRLQASFSWLRTDAARFDGLGESLRQALMSGLSEGLDAKICGQVLADLTIDSTAVTDTFSTYRNRLLYSQIDGRFASVESDIRLLVGSETLAALASTFRGNNTDQATVDSLRRVSGGVRVSANLPDAVSNKQPVIVRRGSRMDLVAPLWRAISLIPDEISDADTGLIRVSAILLYASKTIRLDGFAEVETKHS